MAIRRLQSPCTPTFKGKGEGSLSPLLGRKKRIAIDTSLHSPQPPPLSLSSQCTNSTRFSPHFRTPNRLSKLRSVHSQLLSLIEDRKCKLALAILLKRHYGIVFSRARLETSSKETMVQAAVQKRSRRVGIWAAKRMKEWIKQQKVDKVHREMQAMEHLSAFRIQIYWKTYCKTVIFTRKEAEKRTKAAVIIQSAYRGYRYTLFSTRLAYMKLKSRAQIDSLSRHYRILRLQLHHNAAVKISKAWKRFKVVHI